MIDSERHYLRALRHPVLRSATAGVFLRRNLITMLLSIEIMLNAVNLTFVAVGRLRSASVDGQIIVFFVDDRGGRRSGRRAGAGDRAVPAQGNAQPGRVHVVEVVGTDPRCLLLIPLLPLVGFLINAFFGKRLPKSVSGGVACAVMVAAFGVVGHRLDAQLLGLAPESRIIEQTLYTWIASGDFHAPLALPRSTRSAC